MKFFGANSQWGDQLAAAVRLRAGELLRRFIVCGNCLSGLCVKIIFLCVLLLLLLSSLLQLLVFVPVVVVFIFGFCCCFYFCFCSCCCIVLALYRFYSASCNYLHCVALFTASSAGSAPQLALKTSSGLQYRAGSTPIHAAQWQIFTILMKNLHWNSLVNVSIQQARTATHTPLTHTHTNRYTVIQTRTHTCVQTFILATIVKIRTVVLVVSIITMYTHTQPLTYM